MSILAHDIGHSLTNLLKSRIRAEEISDPIEEIGLIHSSMMALFAYMAFLVRQGSEETIMRATVISADIVIRSLQEVKMGLGSDDVLEEAMQAIEAGKLN